MYSIRRLIVDGLVVGEPCSMCVPPAAKVVAGV